MKKTLFVLVFLLVGFFGYAQTEVTRDPISDGSFSAGWNGTADSRYLLMNDYPDATGFSKLQLSSSSGGTCYFNINSLSVPSNAINITVYIEYYDQKAASQGANFGSRLWISMLPYNSTTHNPANATWTTRSDTWTTDPTTSAAWTPNGVNQIAGVGFNSTDASPAISVSCIRLRVTYDLQTAPTRRVMFIN